MVEHVSARGQVEPAEDVEEGGLAAAGGAEEHDELLGSQLEVHAPQRVHLHLSHVVDLRDPPCLEDEPVPGDHETARAVMGWRARLAKPPGPHGQHRAGGLAHDVVSGRAQDHPSEGTVAVRSHHDEVDALRGGDPQDLLVGPTCGHALLDHARGASFLGHEVMKLRLAPSARAPGAGFPGTAAGGRRPRAGPRWRGAQ